MYQKRKGLRLCLEPGPLLPEPLTAPNAQLALRQAGSSGRVEVTSHFKMRASQRRFTTVDALNVLRAGRLEGTPEYCPEFENWKYTVSGKHDRGCLYIVAALDLGKDRDHSPLAVLVTGYIR
jgi:hypothetical protein